MDYEFSDDQIIDSSNDEALNGNSGKDNIGGGKGDDNISGERGADTLKGGKGDDTLDGGEGNDLLVGGKGSDTYQLSVGNDTIQGYKAGDQIVLSDELIQSGLSKNDVEVETTRIDGKESAILSYRIDGKKYTTTVISVDDADDVEIENQASTNNQQGTSGADDLDGGRKSDYIKSGDGNDVIDGGKGDDTIDAGDDNDIVDGGKGDDVLNGEDGNDELSGGNGDDTLVAGEGDDTLAGGRGADVFDLSNGDNTINDFNIDAGDKLYLGGKAIVETKQLGQDLELVLSDNSKQSLKSVEIADFEENIDEIIYETPTTFSGSNDADCDKLISNNQRITLAEDKNIKIEMNGGLSQDAPYTNMAYGADIYVTNKTNSAWPGGNGKTGKAFNLAFDAPWVIGGPQNENGLNQNKNLTLNKNGYQGRKYSAKILIGALRLNLGEK